MPIRLNLLREYHAAEEARRKDPVKRSILGGVVLVVCLLVWSLILQFQAMRSNAEFSGVQGRWQSIESAYKTVVEHRQQLLETQAKLASLQQLTTNRFLWGSTLNDLQHVLAKTEGSVTITRIRGDQTFSQQADVKPKSPKETAARAPAVVEKIQLTVDARDWSAQPGDQVPRLKAALATPQQVGTNAPLFTNQVALLSISAPQNDKGEREVTAGNGFVTFTLQSTYPERVRQ
jgi:hypothetical protein